MKLRAYSVYDVKAEAFLQPFFFLTRGQAIRAFVDAVNNPEHEFSKHTEDYTLFAVGVFDQKSGEFTAQAAESLGSALQFKNVQQELAIDAKS